MVLRTIQEFISHGLWPVNIRNEEPARFAGGFHGDIADIEKALPDTLIDPDILQFGQLNGSGALRCHAGFIA